jgi:hypothetical protein
MKFSEQRLLISIPQAITYFEDADNSEDPVSLNNQTWEDVKTTICRAVNDYLAARGINTKRVVAKGYGEAELLNNCDDDVMCKEDQHQANRRTEFKILDISAVGMN